ncbi:MAG: RIP metalloprotease RseP [Alphaproteobacteria bacterium]|nr:RIP metalloprotease RseP [Alphaproteobacteria bacterium]PPR12667.1 MAG: Metalloprotease MmpA [Alphaproteobacteria bacterium MarineAlpha12_Bin1]|tara:strand:- start:55470 stop:56588 length:1119 start_codon:yes stop_codon:yes gene_type:complete
MSEIILPIVGLLIVLTPLVFVHELGHYWVARKNGVRVEVFSVGFGKEIFGWTDRVGTRWKFSLIPLGGYVKMFGQSDIGSEVDESALSFEEQRVSFSHKKLSQRAAIVAAGPLANIIFAILILAISFATIGQSFTPAKITGIVPGSVADKSGFKENDLFVEVAGSKVSRFEEVAQLVQLHPGIPIKISIEREGAILEIPITPSVVIASDGLGDEIKIGRIGVRGTAREFIKHGPIEALWQSLRATAHLSTVMITGVAQIISGERSAKQLGGPIRIAQISGKAAESGIASLIFIAALLSVNLGLINLLPIPLLDGGHLLFYAYEFVFRAPPHPKVVDVGLKIGLALVISLMLFATYNDLEGIYNNLVNDLFDK